MFKYLLIDADGTICETKELHYKALNNALKSLYYNEIPWDQHTTIYDGLSTIKKLQILAEKEIISSKYIEQINKLKQDYTMKLLESEFQDKYDIAGKFKKFKEFGFKIAICSNMVRPSLDLIIDKLNIKDLIDFSLSNQDVVNPKPSPDIYLKAMEKFNATKGECIVLEDNEKGIASAVSAGINYIWINNPNDLEDLVEEFI